MLLVICKERNHHVHASLRWPCSWPDFLGKNQWCTLQPMFWEACGLWNSLRHDHCNTEDNHLQAFKTHKTWDGKSLHQHIVAHLSCSQKLPPRPKNPNSPESEGACWVLGVGQEEFEWCHVPHCCSCKWPCPSITLAPLQTSQVYPPWRHLTGLPGGWRAASVCSW